MPTVTVRAVPVAVSFVVVTLITAVLWYLKLEAAGLRDPVFFYALPVTVMAILYGSGPALLGVFAAFLYADFFLYDPLYSFEICSRAELGDLSCFTLLAVIGIKCATKVFRRPGPVQTSKLDLDLQPLTRPQR